MRSPSAPAFAASSESDTVRYVLLLPVPAMTGTLPSATLTAKAISSFRSLIVSVADSPVVPQTTKSVYALAYLIFYNVGERRIVYLVVFRKRRHKCRCRSFKQCHGSYRPFRYVYFYYYPKGIMCVRFSSFYTENCLSLPIRHADFVCVMLSAQKCANKL